MHLCLFEDERVPSMRPLAETRPVYDVRLGARTILEALHHVVAPDQLILHTRPLVASVAARAHPNALVNTVPDGADVLFVNGRFAPESEDDFALLRNAPQRDETHAYVHNDTLLAAWVPDAAQRLPDDALAQSTLSGDVFGTMSSTTHPSARLLQHPWNLLDNLRGRLTRDLDAQMPPPSTPLTGRTHAQVHESVTAVHPDRIRLEEDVNLKPGALLNAEDGPIFIDRNAVIHERAVIRGPCYIGPKTHVKAGANVDGLATGTWCKIGGEVHDSIVHAFTNKPHAGFLGHSYLGQWCNLGADTNNSNLKNDYGEVTAYDPHAQDFVNTNRQFAGLFMGDHSKCGINTMLNTGTVVGTNCNLYGGDFPPRYVPPFSWGSPSDGFTTYRLEKALDVAERVMGRRDTAFTTADRDLLTRLFRRTADERDAHHA